MKAKRGTGPPGIWAMSCLLKPIADSLATTISLPIPTLTATPLSQDPA